MVQLSFQAEKEKGGLVNEAMVDTCDSLTHQTLHYTWDISAAWVTKKSLLLSSISGKNTGCFF